MIKIYHNQISDLLLRTLSKLARFEIVGMTLSSRMILLRKGPINKLTLAHELVHVQQITDSSWIRFFAGYLWESIKHGYAANKFELQAYREQAAPKYQNQATQILST